MRRVVITGLGAICAIGDSPEEIFASTLAARSGVAPAVDLAVSPVTPLVARSKFITGSIASRLFMAPLDRGSALALAVARQAVADPRPASDSAWLRDAAVYWGTGAGGSQTLEESYHRLFAQNVWRLKPTTVISAMHNAPAACISVDLGIAGPTLTYSIACASAAIAIGEAMLAIRSGRVPCALAGGSDACLTRGVLTAWSGLRALAVTDQDDPASSCKPFAHNRSGFVLGEGAAALLLEDAEHATARGARVYAELAGYGIASDAAHMAEPAVDGQVRAITAALQDASMVRGDIGYVNAHGTGTRSGDQAEVMSLKQAFGEHASKLAISSTKALHGHVMGATGAIEAVIAVLALCSGRLPPTAHLARVDPAFDLDFLADGPRSAPDIRAVMSNSFAFGGTNAVLIARRSAGDRS